MRAELYWPAAVLLMAAAQGLLMPAIRRTPPGPEAKRQAFALHVLLTVLYFLPIALVIALDCVTPFNAIAAAIAARLLLFDPVLNLAAGDAAFAVGQTAATDRALQWLAARVGWPASRVRAVVWGMSLLLITYYLIK